MALTAPLQREAATDGDTASGLVSEDELAAQALAADTGLPPDDAPCWWDLVGDDASRVRHLPDWYMPAPRAGVRRAHGWRRLVVVLLVASFLAINAVGLCSTYGPIS